MSLTVIRGHVSPETAYVVNDYPYGFKLRCKIRYWLEKATKGAKKGQYRFMSQTTNPKIADREVWNKPNASVYLAFAVMTKDDANGYIHWAGLHQYFWPEHSAEFTARIGGFGQLNSDELDEITGLLEKARAQSPKSWAKWDGLVNRVKSALPNFDPNDLDGIKGSVEAQDGGNPVHKNELEAAIGLVKVLG